MLERRLILGAMWAGALCSCSLGYELILNQTGGSGGAGSSLGGAGGAGGSVDGSGAAFSSGGTGGFAGGAAGGAAGGGTGGAAASGGSAPSDGGMGGQAPDPLDLPVIALSAGPSHTCALSAESDVYCFGSNANEALGGYVGASSATPVPVGGVGASGEFVTLSVGAQNACGLTANGDVYCWGNNAFGSLGQGDTTNRADPVLVPLPARAVQVDLGFETACAVDELGGLYCWGRNAEGQAGQNDSVFAPLEPTSPLEVPSSVAWQKVSTGDGHVCALRVDGQLYCWGRNTSGELGVIGGGQIRTPTQVGTDTDWSVVSTGQHQTCALKSNRTLHCWGDNTQSQLGMEPPGTVSTPTQVGTDADWTSISVDFLHTCGTRDPGWLYCWGRRQEGQLTIPYDPMPVATPMLVGTNSDWTDLAVGHFHTCARRAGAYYCTGENVDGRLGDGTMLRPYAFVPVLPF